MIKYNRFRNGFAAIPKASSESDTKGEIEFLTSDNKLRLQNGTINDPFVTEAATATLTNKTLSGNTAVTLISGSGTLTLNTTGTVTVPNTTDTLVGKATTDTLTNKSMDGNNNTFTNLPSGALPTDVVYLTAIQTLTNKTLTSPIISTIVNSGTLTLPTTTTTLVGRTTTDTLTNKSISGSTNTLTNIPSGALPPDVVYETATQTISNKTLTTPIISSPTVMEYILADNTTNLTILGGGTNRDINIQAQGSGDVNLTTSTGQVSLNGIEFNTTNQITGTASSDMEVRAKTGQSTKINSFNAATLLQRDGITIASVTSGTLQLAAGKTLSSAGGGSVVMNTSGAMTVPNATDTLVGKATTDTLTNKTIDAGSNAITGLIKSDVGLSNVDNTSDANKPVSTATQTALNLKADLASPALTGTPTAPTATGGTNTTQVATTAFVTSAVSGNALPSGMMAPYAGSSAPTGWQLCDGSAINRTTYAALFAIIGTTYGVGNGSTTFNLPDTRNVFLRGANASTRSIGGTTYPAVTLGSTANDKMQGHTHTGSIWNYQAAGALLIAAGTNWGATTLSAPSTDGSNGTPRTGTETVPVNLGINYIIKE